MIFWQTAYNKGWISPDKDVAALKLRIMVKSEMNEFGEITAEEYEQITGIEF